MFVNKFDVPPNEHIELYGTRCPLTEAVVWGQFPLMKHMIEKYHLDVNVKGKDGCSLLHWAVKGGSVEMVDWLIDTYGFDVNEPTENYKTHCLMLATARGWLSLFKHLVHKYHMDPKEVVDDWNCLQLACHHGYTDLMTELIVNYGCDPQTAKNDGRNCLHLAASQGHVEVVKDLVEKYHLDITAKTKVDSSQSFILSVVYELSIEDFCVCMYSL
jgi:ankyrin repeat protein